MNVVNRHKQLRSQTMLAEYILTFKRIIISAQENLLVLKLKTVIIPMKGTSETHLLSKLKVNWGPER